MTRQEANLHILDVLFNHVNKNPDLKFCQILYNLGVVTKNSNEYNIESEATLNVLLKKESSYDNNTS